MSTIQTKQYPSKKFIEIRCTFSGPLIKNSSDSVDIKYETYQADILYNVRDVTIDSVSAKVACSSIFEGLHTVSH
jgi:hypothetical protein